MLTEAQKQAFEADGFLLYDKPVLTDAQLTEMRAALARVLEGKSESAAGKH